MRNSSRSAASCGPPCSAERFSTLTCQVATGLRPQNAGWVRGGPCGPRS
ncbi:hypothetical protein [Streptomyces sp. 184]